jgi:hypothetical protein
MNAPIRSPGTGTRIVGLLPLLLGIWVTICQLAVMVAGGLAGVSVVILLSGVLLAACGLTAYRGKRRAAIRLGGGVVLAVGISSFLFYDCRNWTLVYAEQTVFNQLGYRDEYEFPAVTIGQTFEIARSKGVDFESEVERLMRQHTSGTTLLWFVSGRFVRVSAWPPVAYISKNGTSGVFGKFW